MNDDQYQYDGRGPHRGGGMAVLLIILTIIVLIGGVWFLARRWPGRAPGVGVSVQEESERETQESTAGQTQEPEAQEQRDVMRAAVLDVSGVVKEAMPSVVAITNKSEQEILSFFRGTRIVESKSSGSGFILAQNDEELLIATNYHVIEGASSLTVCFNAQAENEDLLLADAVEKGSEPQYDLAVVSVKTADVPQEVLGQISVARLGSSDDLLVGEPTIAIGNALGYGQSVTHGIVSALNRTLKIDGAENRYIQTDAAINFGNSGGELLNVDGEVIGINSAKAADTGVEGMGYAIPIDEAKPILEKLMNRVTRERVDEEEQGYLAIYTQDISSEARSLYEIPNGVYIYGVVSDSSAQRAGLRKGDIISRLDGNTVTSTERLAELLAYYRAGETVTVTILRADGERYQETELEVTFEEQTRSSGQPGGGIYGWSFFG